MNQLQVLNNLATLELTKGGIEQMANQISEVLINNEIKPIEGYVRLKAYVECFTKAMEQIKESAINDSLDYAKQGEQFNFLGVKVQVKEAGVKYDYTNCNDPEYAALEERIATETKALKARAKYLQGVKQEGETILQEESGEVYKIYPPAKSSTTTITLTFNK